MYFTWVKTNPLTNNGEIRELSHYLPTETKFRGKFSELYRTKKTFRGKKSEKHRTFSAGKKG